MDGLAALFAIEFDGPAVGVAAGAGDFGADVNGGALVGGIAGIEHDEARVIDPAIGIFKAQAIAGLERLAGLVAGEIEGFGGGQQATAAHVVVHGKASAQHHGGAEALVVG